MVAFFDPFLSGTGAYTPQEAALYARIHTSVLNRWLFGNKSSARVFARQHTAAEGKIVTFLDFVQSLAIRSIRTNHHISPPAPTVTTNRTTQP